MQINQEIVGFSSNSHLKISQDEKNSLISFFCTVSSELTEKEYKRACGEFLNFISVDIEGLSELRRDHLILYQKYLEQRQLAKLTILKKISAVSSLCKHLAHDGIIERDLSYGLKRPKAEINKKAADLSDEEVKLLFSKLDPSKKSFTSHRAMLSLGFYTGLRSSEIRKLKMANLAELEGHRVISLRIKGDKNHEVPVAPFVWMCISEHVNYLKSIGVDVTVPEQCLFPGLRPLNNSPISATALASAFKIAMKNAGIATSTIRRYSPHSMRATFAGHLLNTQKVPLEEVQRILGHSSPTTTQKYNKRNLCISESPIYRVKY